MTTSSASFIRFKQARQKADLLLSGLPSKGPDARAASDLKQIRFHAHLAGMVGAWEAYIESVTEEYLNVIRRHCRRPIDLALHGLLAAEGQRQRQRFNTPNWENCREHLINFTGFDPISWWVWPKWSLTTPISCQERLNEILKLRHSFAHGFAMPAFTWLHLSGSSRLLSVQVCNSIAALLEGLCEATDSGLYAHLKSVAGSGATW